jgi:plastocyanin
MRVVRGGALLALAVLPACGGGEPPARAAGGRLAVTQVDYRFRPQALEARRGRLVLTVVNRARLPHTLRLLRDGREVVRIASVAPGSRTTVARRLRPGEYRMLCAIGNHEELGMWGTLVVR